MNWTKIKEILKNDWIKVRPYMVAFGSFLWTNKTYSLVTFVIGALFGIIFF